MSSFEIVDIPEAAGAKGPISKYAELRAVLVALAPGKCTRVPIDTFRDNQPHGALRMGTFGPYKLRARKLPDGWYLWLERMDGKDPARP